MPQKAATCDNVPSTAAPGGSAPSTIGTRKTGEQNSVMRLKSNRSWRAPLGWVARVLLAVAFAAIVCAVIRPAAPAGDVLAVTGAAAASVTLVVEAIHAKRAGDSARDRSSRAALGLACLVCCVAIFVAGAQLPSQGATSFKQAAGRTSGFLAKTATSGNKNANGTQNGPNESGKIDARNVRSDKSSSASDSATPMN
ncbi:MAG: hypothetical protein J6S33_01595 [Aeriscardovia sp.]|nr:hypothetical protein [Aeriscardovia sp.]